MMLLSQRFVQAAILMIVLIMVVWGFGGDVGASAADSSPELLPASAQAAGDNRWDDQFGFPGLDAWPNAVTVSGSDVFVGGYFTMAGGALEVNHIARWDGRRWYTLGNGITGQYASADVYAVAVSGDYVYVGGNFGQAGQVVAKGLARWNRSTETWSTLGNGLGPTYYSSPGTIYALAVVGDYIYVGGQFDTIDGVAAASIARFNTTTNTWSPLGKGLGDDSGSGINAGTVRAITPGPGGKIYVGGDFDLAGNTSNLTVNGIAAWNPANGQWSTLGAGLQDNYGYSRVAYAMTVLGNDLYVGGDFEKAGGQTVNRIARWNTTNQTWSGLGSGISGGNYQRVNALTVVNGAVYAGGDFTAAGGTLVGKIARWNPATTSWSGLGTGLTDDFGEVKALAADDSGSLIVGGFFNNTATIVANHIAQWDGQTWNALGKGATWGTIRGEIKAAAVAPDGRVYVGGSFTHINGKPMNNAAVWDGTSWSGLGDIGDEYFDDVNAIVIQGNNVYFGGKFTQAGTISASHIARWNSASQTWSALGSGVNGDVNALAFDVNGTLLVGGNFTTAGSTAVDDVARWNPTTSTWSSLSQAIEFYGSSTNEVFALAVDSYGVWIGGHFAEAWIGGVRRQVNSLLFWDRANNQVVPLTSSTSSNTGLIQSGGSVADVRALAVTDDECEVYIGGYFDQAIDVAANRIARFQFCKGNSLVVEPLASGVGGIQFYTKVRAIAIRGQEVFVGGYFSTAGSAAANLIGVWNRGTNAWQTLGSGMTPTDGLGDVYTIALGANKTYVGGNFLTAGGKPSSGFAVWDNTVQLPPGVVPRVYLPLVIR